ncbi:MAG: exosortase/archaeosortase family protein [Opitutales bacterium]
MPTPDTPQKERRSLYEIGFLALGAAIWVDFVDILHVEWNLNPVYEFGYLVPFLVAFLAYRRLGRIPLQLTAIKRPYLLWILGACLVTILPIHLIRLSNPDWRAVYWLYWLVATAASFAILCNLYGPMQTRRILPASLLMIFALPWPSGIERTLTQTLMEWVTFSTVSCVNWMDIPALQQGQIIALPDAFVGVEEACSGVRSFQSSLMAAWFFGEYYRFSPIQRILLLGIAPVVAFIVNIGRTITLTHTIHHLGTGDFDFFHDNSGWVSTLNAFLLLLGTALIIKATFSRWKPDPKHTQPPFKVATVIPKASAWVWAAIAFLPLSRIAAHTWYWSQEMQKKDALVTQTEWESLKTEVVFAEIPSTQRAILRYTEGELAKWRHPDGPSTVAYFFRWDAGRISSFAGVHSPEVCLPSVGHTLIGEPRTFQLPTEHGNISLKGYHFELALPGGRVIPRIVFFGVWDSDLEPAPVEVVGAAGRLKNVLEGERIRNRTSFQLIMTGPQNFQEAWPQAKEDIGNILTFHPLKDR